MQRGNKSATLLLLKYNTLRNGDEIETEFSAAGCGSVTDQSEEEEEEEAMATYLWR